MLDIRRSALMAAVMIAVLSPWPAMPTTQRDEATKQAKDAAKEFRAGEKLHKEGDYASALEKMERAYSVFQKFEIVTLERLSRKEAKKLTEEERKGRSVLFAFGPYSPFRRRLLSFETAHGCYTKALRLAENEVRWVKAVLPDISSELGLSKVYHRALRSLVSAARNAGQFEQAVTVQSEILDLFRRLQRVQDVRRSYASELLVMASLQDKIGNHSVKRGLIAEVRDLFDKLWREKPPSETRRLGTNAYILQLEGRDEEARGLLEKRLEMELTKKHQSSWSGAAMQLSKVYLKLGRADDAVDTLEMALKRIGNSRWSSYSHRWTVGAAYRLAKAHKKAGDEQAAQKLIDEYRLCL